MSGQRDLDTIGPVPGLQVALDVTPTTDFAGDGTLAVRVAVTEPSPPLRISVYLDGDLVDTWVPVIEDYELRLHDVHGRHVITARAIDASGRWGGASTLVELEG